ncbi:hypothetical protein DAPPUDRAFT_336024, partial [Daphnia pulex]
MAEAKVVQVLVEISHDKLMEFMDFVDRINGDVKKVDMHAEPVPGSLPETAAENESVDLAEGLPIKIMKKAVKCLGEALASPVPPKSKKSKPLTCNQLSAVKAFEEILNYSFNDKEVLLEALTYGNSIRSLNYQRLEVIGDAAFGFLAALNFFKQSLYHSAGDISQLRSACVCNDTFGMLAAKRNFHAYIQNLPPNLVKHLEDFLEFAESENFAPFDRELAENEEIIATQVAIPTFLADVFEAVAGAVITDSNLSFETLEKVFVPFMNSVY